MTEPTEERWAYAGQRLMTNGKPANVWIPNEGADPDTAGLWFSAKGRYVVGGVYRVEVTRADDEKITLHGTPAYVEPVEDRDRRAVWEAKDGAAKAMQARARRERAEAKRSALDDALAPLVAIARQQRTSAERDAFAAYVMRRLMSEW